MKQSLQLRHSQQLTMTPQLQQAIRLLQLSSLELQTEIQQTLESNLMLELEEAPSVEIDAMESQQNSDQELNMEEMANIPDDLPLDSQWQEIYPNQAPNEDVDPIAQQSSETSIQQYLLSQVELLHLSLIEQAIAMAIIDAVDNRGYVSVAMEEICENLNTETELVALAPDAKIDLEEIMVVLHQLQSLEPSGICARNPKECLLIQLQQMPTTTVWRTAAIQLVTRYLHLIAVHDYTQLKHQTKYSDHQLEQILALITHLNPYPADSIISKTAEYVEPDVYVKEHQGQFLVELNPSTLPKIKINQSYANLIQQSQNAQDKTCLRTHLQEARWFLSSLQRRNETLLKIANSIVQIQQDFFRCGEEAMQPLILKDIADQVEMHESTISRVTTLKYMHTPKGIFEFKYFFSSHVPMTNGSKCSATAIRALIKKLVANEPAKKPLSDNKITQLLGDKGIKVARRTVAKYREALLIPPSNERKRLS